MAHPLKAHAAGGTAAEARPVLLTVSERRPTQEELNWVEEPARPISYPHENTDVEFERKKQRVIERSDPVIRVAAFLVAISRQNEHEGRDATIVYDSLKSDAVAELLGLDLDILSRALVTLQRKGLVESANADRLRLKDIDGLERLVDQKHQGVGSFGTAGRISLAPLLAQSSKWLLSELRELAWLFLTLMSLSIVCVAFGAIVAMVFFE